MVLAFMALEFFVLSIVRSKTGRGPQPMDLLVSLLGGAALLGALRAALTGHEWPNVAVFLVLSLVAHGWDLLRRWPPKR